MAAKKELDNKKELARILYMNGETQQVIADNVGVSRITVNKWAKEAFWKEQRAAKIITRPELINKMLINIDTLLEKANESENPEEIAGLGDKLSKLAAAIEKLDKKSGVVETYDVFIRFGRWLELQMDMSKEVTAELVKMVNKYQNLYIQSQLNIRES